MDFGACVKERHPEEACNARFTGDAEETQNSAAMPPLEPLPEPPPEPPQATLFLDSQDISQKYPKDTATPALDHRPSLRWQQLTKQPTHTALGPKKPRASLLGPLFNSPQRKQTPSAGRRPTVEIIESVESRQKTIALKLEQSRALGFVEDHRFKIFIAGVIFTNAVLIGVETDYDLGEGIYSMSFFIELFFFVVYFSEITLRFIAYRCEFFRSAWNLLDLFLVSTSIVDFMLSILFDEADSSLSLLIVLRTLRLCRLVRLLRLFRFFKPLWLIVCGIAASAKALFYAWLLMALLIYVFALVIMRIMDSNRDDPEVVVYFGSVPGSMFSIFQVITTENWNTIALVCMRHYSWLWIVYIMILGLCTFAILNVVIGIVCESTVEAARARSGDLAMRAKLEHEEVRKKLLAAFQRADVDQSGTLSRQEFEKALELPWIHDLMREMKLNPESMIAMFEILDIDGSGALDSSEFMDAVLQITGTAPNKDLVALQCDLWRSHKSMVTQLSLADKQCQNHIEYSAGNLWRLRREIEELHELIEQMPDTKVVGRAMQQTRLPPLLPQSSAGNTTEPPPLPRVPDAGLGMRPPSQPPAPMDAGDRPPGRRGTRTRGSEGQNSREPAVSADFMRSVHPPGSDDELLNELLNEDNPICNSPLDPNGDSSAFAVVSAPRLAWADQPAPQRRFATEPQSDLCFFQAQ